MSEETCCVQKGAEASFKDYWNENFLKLSTPNWIETEEPFIMEWVRKLDLPKTAQIFCAGVGDANIVQYLLEEGFKNIIANDISNIALDKLASNLNSDAVTYLQDDLINPKEIDAFHGKIDLYIDRATLHFFTTCDAKAHYFQQIDDLLKSDGYSVLGVFDKNNKAKCCGLDLQLWSLDSLRNRLSAYYFIEEDHFPFEEINGNIRNYIYLLAQKS
jgi:SAM-dependent methyltransferase